MTLSMNMPENEDVQLTEQNFRNVCRLCLRADEDFINVFDRIDQNPLKRPLTERIYDLYQIKLLKEDGLPTNICYRCLYNTELFFEFREEVHKCEHKLQDFVSTLASRSDEVRIPTEWHLDDILHDQHESNEFYKNSVVVVDPLKCYVSSDDEGNEGGGSLEMHNEISNVVLPLSEQRPSANNKRHPPKQLKKSNALEPKPLRNICFCKYCEAAFAQRTDCEAHELNTHDPVMPYACNFCPFRFDNQTNFIGHIRQLHDPERPYFCTQCNKNFGRRADLRKHAVSHTGIRPFSCPICGKTFSRKTNVTNHMKVHEDKKQNNKEPPRSEKPAPHRDRPRLKNVPAHFAQMMSLEGYQPQYQQSFPPFPNQGPPYPGFPMNQFSPSKQENAVYSKCTVKSDPNTIPKLKLKLKLPKQAPQKNVLRQFACQIQTCKKMFKTKRDLNRHSQTHSGAMKFHCSTCQKGFARRDKLVRHEKIHANRNKTAALPESAFLPENLKRGSHLSAAEHKSSPASGSAPTIERQPFIQDAYRPQFYAEYDLSETNN